MNFKRKHRNFQFLDKRKNIYTIASELRNDICYAADNTRFCIIDYEGLMFCPLEEVPAMAEKFKPKFKAEVMAIYQDIMDMKRMAKSSRFLHSLRT